VEGAVEDEVGLEDVSGIEGALELSPVLFFPKRST